MVKSTIIISLGLMQKLEHSATGDKFKLMSKGKLDDAQINKAMPQILALDLNLKAGKCKVQEFRQAVLDILDLEATPQEFDAAWNAMQGGIQILFQQLQEIKRRHPDTDIILLSKTNPIHIENIFHQLEATDNDVIENPQYLLGMPLHLSYLSPAYKETSSDIAFYDEVVKSHLLKVDNTSIILQCTSDSKYPAAKKRDEDNVRAIQQWAQLQGIGVIDRAPQEQIVDSISRAHETEKNRDFILQQSGTKLPSGNIQLWSFKESNSITSEHNQVPTNSIKRP